MCRIITGRGEGESDVIVLVVVMTVVTVVTVVTLILQRATNAQYFSLFTSQLVAPSLLRV